jgi:asparagine synthase (glutamine-hydrolysing)
MADLASVPFYFLARRAARNVKVLLSGEGADEILAGYDFDRVLKSLGIQKVGIARHHLSKLVYDRFAKQYSSNPIVMTNLFSENEKRDGIRSSDHFPDSLDYARVAIQSMRGFDSLERILNAYRQDWLVEDLLFRADRMSMANSIEVRTPFLDFRLVSWLSTLPLDRKVGFEGGELVTKRLLRRFAKGRVPETVITRGKMGFSIPVYGWQDSDFSAWAAQALLSNNETRVSEYLTHDFVKGVFGQAFGQTSTNLDRHRLWSLLTLEYWLRAWT